MALFQLLDINVFSAMVLLILLFNIRTTSNHQNKPHKLFSRLTGLVLFLVLSEIISFAVDKQPGSAMVLLNYVSNMNLYLFAPFVMALWSEYVEHYLFREVPDLRRRRLIRSLPVVALLVLILLNPFTGGLFTIEAGNVYQRGPLFVQQMLLNFIIVFQAYFTLYKNRRHLDMTKLISLAAFPFLPMVGATLQSIFYGTTLIWSSVTLALLVIFLNVQKALLMVDSLTGIENRRSIDQLIDSMSERRRDVLYGGMMLDMDNLKEINDQYGHSSGDQAIKHAADILKDTLRKGDFVARYAGDEFFVVIEVENYEALEASVERIRKAFSQFNQHSREPWAVEVSIGYDVFCYESAQSVDQAMRRIDELMYQEKKKRKLERRLAAESSST